MACISLFDYNEVIHVKGGSYISSLKSNDVDKKSSDGNAASQIGYWAAQEQYSMAQLLKFVVKAEEGGFSTTMTSDHFHPWWNDDAFGNFTWAWIAAAAERTRKMKFVTGVTSPVYRYHPAIIAQAFASLDVLYPGRIGLGLGTGEAMNELPLGFEWPSAKVRLARTKEAIEIIEKLWGRREKRKEEEGNQINDNRDDDDNDNDNQVDDDGFVTYNGRYYHIRNAKLYTPPASHNIPLYLAASGKESARIAAQYSDGLVTFLKPEQAAEVLSTFDKTAESKGRPARSLEKIAEYKVSYAEDYDRAFESTEFWRATLLKDVFGSKISDPRRLEEKAKREVPDEKLKESIQITTSIEDCIGSLEKYFKAGFTTVCVHSTSPDEIKFIEDFCRKVLPYFAGMDETATTTDRQIATGSSPPSSTAA